MECNIEEYLHRITLPRSTKLTIFKNGIYITRILRDPEVIGTRAMVRSWIFEYLPFILQVYLPDQITKPSVGKGTIAM